MYLFYSLFVVRSSLQMPTVSRIYLQVLTHTKQSSAPWVSQGHLGLGDSLLLLLLLAKPPSGLDNITLSCLWFPRALHETNVTIQQPMCSKSWCPHSTPWPN